LTAARARIAMLAGAAAIVAGCGDAGEPPPPQGVGPLRGDQELVYAGTALVAQERFETCGGGRRRTGRSSGRVAVTLVVSGPAAGTGGRRDTNPLHLTLTSDAQGPDGSFALQSAFFTVSRTERTGLVTAWALTYDRGSGALRGRLDATRGRSGAALENVVYTRTSRRPCAGNRTPVRLAGGTIRGRITRDAARLTIAGRTSAGRREVRIRAVLRPA
jgi:hypothetical protein